MGCYRPLCALTTHLLARDCGLDDSCVFCERCFLASEHTGHNVSFYLTQQPGGCCDCGDPEAWKRPIDCKFHPTEPLYGPYARSGKAVDSWSIKPTYPSVPQDLRDSMSRTVAYALDFVLDTLDFSPDETVLPQNEHELRKQDTADPIPSELYAVLLWNDEKHSFDEFVHHVKDSTGCTIEEATRIAKCIDLEVRMFRRPLGGIIS